MCPEVGSSSFNISLIIVDFPEPELPTRKANSPLLILKFALCIASSVPVGYFLLTFLNSIIFNKILQMQNIKNIILHFL